MKKQLGARLGLSWKRHKRTHSFPDESLLQAGLLTDSRETIASAGPELLTCETVGAGGRQSDDEAAAAAAPIATVTKRQGKKLERYSSQFGLEEQETVLKVCPCFLVSDLLIQGCLIITERHVCFHSSMFGMRKNKKIKFEDILQITKEKVCALFPTGIGVRTRTEKITFSSATSRDRMLQLLRQQQQRVTSVGNRCATVEAEHLSTAPDDAAPSTSGTADSLTSETQSLSTRSCVTMATRDTLGEALLTGQLLDPPVTAAAAAAVSERPRSVNQNLVNSNKCDSGDSRCYSNSPEIRNHPAIASSERDSGYKRSLLTGKAVGSAECKEQQKLQKLLLASLIALLAILVVTGVRFSFRLGEMERQVMLTAADGAGPGQRIRKDIAEQKSDQSRTAAKSRSLDLKLSNIIEALNELQKKLLQVRPLLQFVNEAKDSSLTSEST